MKRILFYSPGGVENISGGEVSLLLIITMLKKYSPLVLLDKRTQFCDRLEENGIEVLIVEKRSNRIPIIGGLVSMFLNNLAIFKILKKHRVDIVHANNSDALQNSILACIFTGTKRVFNIRGTPTIGTKWLLLLWGSNAIITNSNELTIHVLNNTFSAVRRIIKSKIHGVYSGLDLSKEFVRNPLFLELNKIDTKKVQVSIIGAIRPLKQQLELIKNTMAKVVQNEKDFVLNIIGSADYGDEEYLNNCKKAVEKLGLESHVRFIPFNNDMPEWYALTDFTVLVSKKEGLARVMIEGMSYGTPMISFEVSSAKEILDAANCGEVVGLNDFDGMASAMIRLIKDKARIKTYSENAKLFVKENLDIRNTAANYEAIYDGL